MGYYTSFELNVHEGNLAIHEILEQISETEFTGLHYAIDRNGESIDSTKWYNHEEDMKGLSKRFPDIVFILKGEGEDSQDVWKKYFKNGKMQECHAIITFIAYDESRLR